MTSPRTLHTSLPQQALSLGLAAVVTAALLSGVLGLAGADQAAQLAQRLQAAPQAIAQQLVAPQS
ncbi:MAG: hypothetical protein V4795_05375 [Pseudomonadota bacterium]|jgi:hypothetical protein